MQHIPHNMYNSIVGCRNPEAAIRILHNVLHMIPIRQPASGKRKCSEPIMPSIGQTDSHTAATAYPTIPLTVLTQGRNAIRIEIRRVGFSQHLHFLSFLINQDTTVIGSEPYFSILTLNNVIDRGYTGNIREFRDMGKERQHTGFIILACQPITSGTQPKVFICIGKQSADGSSRHVILCQIQRIESKRRLFRVYHQDTAANGTQPDIIEAVAQQ